MIKFLLAFLKTYLLPAVKIAVAEAVVNQIQDKTYGPRYTGNRRPYGMNQYGRRLRPVDED